MNDLISIDPEILGGTPCFRGTRVPVTVLFYNLADGLSLDEIFDCYPTMPRAAVQEALQQNDFPIAALQGHAGAEEMVLWRRLAQRECSKLSRNPA
jgi:uncharacterized protein (DUF433 family)